MSSSEPIAFAPRPSGTRSDPSAISTECASVTAFNRQELGIIFDLYGRKVAGGEWRDYALDLLSEKAIFSVFRRTTEFPLYRIEKCPRLGRKQGAYSVVSASGQILKRGHDLKRVLSVLDSSMRLVSAG